MPMLAQRLRAPGMTATVGWWQQIGREAREEREVTIEGHQEIMDGFIWADDEKSGGHLALREWEDDEKEEQHSPKFTEGASQLARDLGLLYKDRCSPRHPKLSFCDNIDKCLYAAEKRRQFWLNHEKFL